MVFCEVVNQCSAREIDGRMQVHIRQNEKWFKVQMLGLLPSDDCVHLNVAHQMRGDEIGSTDSTVG
jgi:hypothetical protein